jgi:alpha-1,3-glucan synthase
MNLFLSSLLLCSLVSSLRFDPEYVNYNLNQNQNAQSPLEYSGQRNGHNYHPSPEDWRFPFYTITLDRFVNGDPSNDNANGTLFEQDITSTQIRHGGDIQGLVDTLDYLQGMGIKVCDVDFPSGGVLTRIRAFTLLALHLSICPGVQMPTL